ncbi:E3 ubiquitin-protein ligase RNF115 [Chiloscyllium plagiosum]|uniref:E3 ubiquitin-protein ligase RNF115 n=1 Tax=Chiloscyllium plagiosum TaxID=36176 RepID=UPI001CB826DE|nr:E3 ubiquitin-protein ligase RNF115 [Chiloscyllium plagiosum]
MEKIFTPEYTCPRCESGFIEEVTDETSFLDNGTNGLDDDSATQFAELWDRTFLNLDQTFLFVDGRPLRSGTSLDHDGGELERGSQQNDIWGPSRHTRLPMARRYRARGASRPERSPAIEGIIQQLFAGLFNAGISGSQQTFSWSGMLHSNPADYAWGQSGLDAVITQVRTTASSVPVLVALIHEWWLRRNGEDVYPDDDANIPYGHRANDRIVPFFDRYTNKDMMKTAESFGYDYDKSLTYIAVDSGLECPVCKEDYLLEEQVRQLPCNHFFHSDCIVPWLELHDTCPVCRKSLNGEVTMGHRQTSEELSGNLSSSENRQRDPWAY